MYFKTQKFLVVGASKSGFAVVKFLLNKGAQCRVYEELKTIKAESALAKLKELGVDSLTREQAFEYVKNADVLILSPGVPINHEIAVMAKQAGIRIIGELEFAYLAFIPPMIAVTGTNGKTTTVTLIDSILNRLNIKNELVGNIGVPMSAKLEELKEDTVAVVEVSSFQLESVSDFKPHISCILNIAPDHLERHYSMENYVFLKKRIFRNQKESEYCVLNFDDDTVKSFFPEVRAKVVWVSIKEKVDGAYVDDGKIYFKNEYIIDTKALKIYGEHNLYNSLFAVCCAKLLGLDSKGIADALSEFKGVEHRIEFVCDKNGIEYYNDSKATNTASTISALDAITKPTVLILGGSEKGENYDFLFEKIKLSSVKHIVLTGASRYNMLDCASRHGIVDITLTEDFSFAVKIAEMLADDGDAVLLSPACASFDKFNGFEERGEEFKKIVKDLADNAKT